MAEIQKTNICCIDLSKDCIDYLNSLGLAVYEGSFGSVFSFKWDVAYTRYYYVLSDLNLPDNLHEYHVFVGDTDIAVRREYKPDEHHINDIANPKERCLTCSTPINILDLRPYGSRMLCDNFKNDSNKRIQVVFIGDFNSVSYTASEIGYYYPKTIGTFSNYDAWSLLNGERKYGNRVVFEDNSLSRILYEGRLNQVKYYHTFKTPYVGIDNNQKVDPNYIPLLKNENGECVSYLYCTKNGILFCVLPQVEDKSSLLKSLFENILFPHYSKFFPDVEAKLWIHKEDYLLPEEKTIRDKIAAKREELEKEIAELEKQAESAGKKNEFLKYLLTGTGGQLVKAVKTYLEWLGFKNVIDKDETLAEGDIKEEDLDLNYNGQLVLVEVKGINGTSTDAECSQVDKIVSRRIKQLDTTKVHGVYVVNNQKNVEPLNRQIPPFNKNQVSDAESMDRTLVYTSQLFALYSDIENGYVTREEARGCFLRQGLANFHTSFKSLGKPYDYYHGHTIICLDLKGDKVSVGDIFYYKDGLQRLVGLKVECIQQNNTPMDYVEVGKTAIKVDKKVPNGVEIFLRTL